MSLNIPQNATEIFNRMAVDITIELDNLDPFLRNSFIKAITVGDANAFFEMYKTLNEVINQTFWDTATGEFLERWAAIYGITRLPATKANGFVTFIGIDGSSIPLGSQFTSKSGESYQTSLEAVVSDTFLSVLILTRVSKTAIVVTNSEHGFASGMETTISGADQPEYNGAFVIVVTGLNSFTYTIVGNPATTATGTIIANAVYANVNSESLDFGDSNNLSCGTKVSLSSPIAGVDTDGFVSFDEMGGAADEETDTFLRDRFLFRVQNPIALFNNVAIEDQAKTVAGVTRVFVQNVDFLGSTLSATSLTRDGSFAVFETGSDHGLFDGQVITVDGADQSEYNVTNQKILIIDNVKFGYTVIATPTTPATGNIIASFGVSSIGQVRIFFVRDNDTNIIPTESEVSAVRTAILDIKPATVSASDVIVEAPIPLSIDFTFSDLTPNTETMKTAVTDSLELFFATGTEVSVDVEKIDYESAINNTVDATGARIRAFAFDVIAQITFTQEFTSATGFTFDSAKTEFVGGCLRQKDATPTDTIFYASYNANVNGNWGNGTLTGTLNGTAAVSGGNLVMTGDTLAYADYSAVANANIQQTGTIRMIYIPNYTGSPSKNAFLFHIGQGGGSSNNSIELFHNDNGGPSGNQITLNIKDSTGASIMSADLGVFVAVASQEYEFELNYNITDGNTRLFVDGVQFGSNQTGTGTRDSNINLLRIGSDATAIEDNDSSVGYFLAFNSVQHTANYTAPSTVPNDTRFLGDLITIPLFTDPGLSEVIGFVSFITAEIGAPRYILNGLFSPDWNVSSDTYATAADTMITNDNIDSLPTSETLQIKIATIETNTRADVNNLVVTYRTTTAQPAGNIQAGPSELAILGDVDFQLG